MEADRIKWDARYGATGYFFSFTPSRFLARSLEQVCALAPGRRALDIACGEGRNAIFLAQNGFAVTAVDISEQGLSKGINRAAELGVGVNFVQADLDSYRIEENYDLIVDFNFLLRPLIPMMVDALAPGGVILMETIMNSLQGEHIREFLLDQGELNSLFSGQDGNILLLEEEASGETPVARVIFQKQVGAKKQVEVKVEVERNP
jgi:SAM-dependent methyltransferase